MVGKLTSRFVQDGKDYFRTDMTNEQIIAATQFSSGETQMLARRIAELSDDLHLVQTQLTEAESKLQAALAERDSARDDYARLLTRHREDCLGQEPPK
jgi:hypothetical protein